MAIKKVKDLVTIDWHYESNETVAKICGEEILGAHFGIDNIEDAHNVAGCNLSKGYIIRFVKTGKQKKTTYPLSSSNIKTIFYNEYKRDKEGNPVVEKIEFPLEAELVIYTKRGTEFARFRREK